MKCVTMKVLPRVLLMGRKKTGLTDYNINKTNLNANHVQNWFF